MRSSRLTVDPTVTISKTASCTLQTVPGTKASNHAPHPIKIFNSWDFSIFRPTATVPYKCTD
jgi:hypothetical protein